MTWHIPSDLPCVADTESESSWVLVPEGGEIIALDAVSHLIWRAADGAADCHAVVQRLHDDHGWNGEEIAEPVRHFLADLLDHGLLKVKTT